LKAGLLPSTVLSVKKARGFKHLLHPKGIYSRFRTAPKERQISADEYKSFHQVLKPDFQDFATLQFYCAGRVGEIAGLQKKNIDLDRKFLRIKEVIVWIGNKPQIKSVPKNGCERAVFINATMAEILQRRMGDPHNTTDFIFQRNGAPLRYNQINENYNRALKAAGLADKFSGTHQIRYAAAQMARRVSGSLEAAKSITGHQSAVMAINTRATLTWI
jgi:integrase